jgi:hypothetical protein
MENLSEIGNGIQRCSVLLPLQHTAPLEQHTAPLEQQKRMRATTNNSHLMMTTAVQTFSVTCSNF